MRISTVQPRTPSLIVIPIIIFLLAAVSIEFLMISTFRSEVSPSVEVTVTFPSANANLLVDPVLTILEEAINDTPHIHDMAFAATPFGSAGEATILVTFNTGTDPKAAASIVKNRIQTAQSRLPRTMEADGITVKQTESNKRMLVNIYGANEHINQQRLCDICADHLSELEQIPGIGSASILGYRQRLVRLKLDLDRLRPLKVEPDDVIKAITSGSLIASKQTIIETNRTPQTVEYVCAGVSIGRYDKPEQYENIVIRANEDGEVIRLKEVGKVEVCSLYPSYPSNDTIDLDIGGRSSAVIVLKQLPDANPVVVEEEIKKKLEEWLPHIGMKFDISDELPPSWRLPRSRPQPGCG